MAGPSSRNRIWLPLTDGSVYLIGCKRTDA